MRKAEKMSKIVSAVDVTRMATLVRITSKRALHSSFGVPKEMESTDATMYIWTTVSGGLDSALFSKTKVLTNSYTAQNGA